MRSDKDFITFFKEVMRGKRLALFLFAAIFALLLIFYGGKNETEDVRADGVESTVGELCASVDGVGECIVTVVYEDGGDRVYSVAVVCEGADDIRVRAGLTRLITKLYGIGANRVGIMKLKK